MSRMATHVFPEEVVESVRERYTQQGLQNLHSTDVLVIVADYFDRKIDEIVVEQLRKTRLFLGIPLWIICALLAGNDLPQIIGSLIALIK